MPVYASPVALTSLPRLSIYAHAVPASEPFAPDSPAYIDGITNQVITRADVRTRSLHLAQGLRNLEKVGGLELHKGSMVTVFSPNTVFYPIVMLATAAAGIRAAFANSSYTASELAYILKDSGSSHVLVHGTLLPTVISAFASMGISQDEAKRRVVIISPKTTIPAALSKIGWIASEDVVPGNSLLPEDFRDEKSKETVYIYYSSGTTGRSKGVELSHFNVTSVLEQSRTALPIYEHGRDVVMGVLPFFHVFGGIPLLLRSYRGGIPVVILPGFDPSLFLSSIPRHKITIALLVPPLLRFLAKSPLVDNFDLSSLRTVVVGAAPVSATTITEATQRLGSRGAQVVIYQALGLTETSSVSHLMPVGLTRVKTGTVGCLLPNMQARLVDDSGNDVREGEPGELWLRGPNIMKGYLGKPQANLETFTAEGWLKTEDVLIRAPDGFYSVVDRKKELIKYKGFQVPPAELEAVLVTHPDIADAGVIGIYSEENATEVPRAFVVPKDLTFLKRSDHGPFIVGIQQWMRDRLAHHKQLRGGVVLTDALPRTAAGKILRRRLREMDHAASKEVKSKL